MNDRIELPPDVPGKLYVGAAPRSMSDLPKDAELLVLTANEWQPESTKFPGVRVHRVPLDDVEDPLSPHDYARILSAASVAASVLRDGRVVVSTCAMGLNRSQLVAGMAMRMLGMSSRETIAALRQARGPRSLSNQVFARIVQNTFPR